MEQRLMTVAAALVVSTSMAFAQSQISGKVTSSEDGSPVIGASVKIVVLRPVQLPILMVTSH